MTAARLTPRETQVAELFAWGATKKDVANRLIISIRTVENIARNIFEKTGVTKINELSAWWFCTKFNISFELSPLKRVAVSVLFLIMFMPQVANADEGITRLFRSRTRTAQVAQRGYRRNEDDFYLEV